MSQIKELHVAEWLDDQNDRLSVHDGWLYRSYMPCSSNSQFQHASAVSSMCHVPDPTAPHVLALKAAEQKSEAVQEGSVVTVELTPEAQRDLNYLKRYASIYIDEYCHAGEREERMMLLFGPFDPDFDEKPE